MKKLISIVTACYNEEHNVIPLHEEIDLVMRDLADYAYEHIYIDNASTDNTVTALRKLASRDKRVKIILNTRNFGHIRSPFHGILQAHGDAIISLAADFQEPPSIIKDFVREWEAGYSIVAGVKTSTETGGIMHFLRTTYYRLLRKTSDVSLIENFTGFGLFDRRVIETLRHYGDPYPYFRGLIADTGYDITTVSFTQPARKLGITKNNWYTLMDMALLGFSSHTKLPLRLAILLGGGISCLSFLIGLIYLILKFIMWTNFSAGVAPLVVGIFFIGGIQLLFLGIIGEYIGAIYTQVLRRPLVIEKERINFD